MKIGISALKFNLEDALNICKKNKKKYLHYVNNTSKI